MQKIILFKGREAGMPLKAPHYFRLHNDYTPVDGLFNSIREFTN